MNHDCKIPNNWWSVSVALTPVSPLPWWTFMDSRTWEVRPSNWGIRVYWLAIRTCHECQWHRKLHTSEWDWFLTSRATIFQLYMWRHIDVQVGWRRSLTYGRAPNAIDISQRARPIIDTGPTSLWLFRKTPTHFSRLFPHAWGYGGHILDLNPGSPRGKRHAKSLHEIIENVMRNLCKK